MSFCLPLLSATHTSGGQRVSIPFLSEVPGQTWCSGTGDDDGQGMGDEPNVGAPLIGTIGLAHARSPSKNAIRLSGCDTLSHKTKPQFDSLIIAYPQNKSSFLLFHTAQMPKNPYFKALNQLRIKNYELRIIR